MKLGKNDCLVHAVAKHLGIEDRSNAEVAELTLAELREQRRVCDAVARARHDLWQARLS